MKWILCHRPKRYWLCFSVAFFLSFGLGLLFPSSSASAVPLSNASVYRTLYYRDSSGNGHTLNSSFFATYSSLSGVTLVGDGNPFVAIQGLDINVPGSFGDSSVRSNIIKVVIALKQYTRGTNTFNTLQSSAAGIKASTSSGDVIGSCDSGVYKDFNGLANHRMDWTCYITLPDYTKATSLSFALGSSVASSSGYSSGALAYRALFNTGTNAYPYNPNAIYLDSDITIESSQDASIGVLNQQTQILNQQLSEQQATNSLLQQQIDSQNQANEQQLEQYEAEKQEESDREEAGSEAVDDLTSGISFSITDPLSYIFGAFTASNSCVSIPILKSWLHVSQSQFCPIFPSSIRSVLTPAFSMITGIFCYGFVIKWLKKDEG